MKNQPIGILDSGVGGITIWKEITSLLPHESTVYIGDSMNTPYGARSAEEVYLLAKKLIEFLRAKHAKVIVIACNTITVSSLEKLRAEYPDTPIVGTVPAVKTAVAVTKKKRIGILSTTQTAASGYQKQLIQEFASDCYVVNAGTDSLVPRIEKGETSGKAIREVLRSVLRSFQTDKVDALTLGCTHFPLVQDEIQQLLGKDVHIVHSGPAIARQVKRILENNHLGAEKGSVNHQLYTTGDADALRTLAKKLRQGTIAEDVLVASTTL